MQNNISIIIISYNFYPENNPRAFRTFELAKEFKRREIEVDLVIPDYNYDYFSIKSEYGLNIIKVPAGYLINRNAKGNNIEEFRKRRKSSI